MLQHLQTAQALLSVAVQASEVRKHSFTAPRTTSLEKVEMEPPEVSFLLMAHHPPLLPSRAQEESTGLLSGLRIWHTQLLPGGLQGLILNPIFRQNLRIALLGGYVVSLSLS